MLETNGSGQFKGFNIQPKIIWIILAAILVIVLVATSIFVVDQTEQGVVLRFGRYNRTVGPGLQFKLPLGIEQNFNVPTQRVLSMAFGFRTESPGVQTVYSSRDYSEESLMLTGDLNIIDVEWIIQYRINRPTDWLFNVESRDKTIRDISQSVLNQLVGDLAILDVIGSQRTTIEDDAQQSMQKSFNNYGLGIDVTTVKLQNIVPPVGEVQDAFEDVNKAIQDMNRLINEGKELYNSEIPRTRGNAKRVIQEAEGYASERVNNAQGDIARFTSVRDVYQNSKEVTRTRLYIETLEEVFSNSDKDTIFIDKELDNFLPLQSIQPSQSQPSSQGGDQ